MSNRFIIEEWQSDIRSMAAEFAESDMDPSDYAWECADGCQWSIYYAHAWDLVIAMREHDRRALSAAECSYSDLYGNYGDDASLDLDTRMTRLAYLMTHAALWDALAEMGVAA